MQAAKLGPLYLLDANAIRGLDFEYIRSKMEKEQLITIEDVAYEVRGLDKLALITVHTLGSEAYAEMARLLHDFSSVRSLLSYINNEGMADVAILGYILSANNGRLIHDDYIVVTEDRKLRDACEVLNISWLSVDAFRHS